VSQFEVLPTQLTQNGKVTVPINEGSGTIMIKNFGGVGFTNKPNAARRAEIDTLKFIGSNLTAQNLLLTQQGSDVLVSFAGVANTQVVLKNLNIEDLENLADVGNMIFEGESGIQDLSLDVFNAFEARNRVFNRDAVTFLNDQDNRTQGFNHSDDVINGLGGEDTLSGLSGDDILRGGDSNDRLLGGDGDDFLAGDAGDDFLNGGLGNYTLVGGIGMDTFVLQRNGGNDLITDFTDGIDKIGLANGLTFNRLAITQGTGTDLGDTLIRLRSNGEVLATVVGVQATVFSAADFMAV
jgi:Ca2+-binding RTX toxin-like protein